MAERTAVLDLICVGRCSLGLVVTKFGARGAAARYKAQTVFVPAFPVEIVNALGAGDSFLAGFLAAWFQGANPRECLRRGNANGALVVGRHGSSGAMPYRNEVEEFLASR